MYVYVHILYVRMYARMYVCTHVCMSVCVYMYVHGSVHMQEHGGPGFRACHVYSNLVRGVGLATQPTGSVCEPISPVMIKADFGNIRT